MRSFRCGEYVRDAHPQLFWLKEDARAIEGASREP